MRFRVLCQHVIFIHLIISIFIFTFQLISWLQASDNGVLDLNQALKEWVTGPDGWVGIAVCPVCLELGGQRVPVLSVFSNGEATPPAHPNCRCNMNLVVLTGLE